MSSRIGALSHCSRCVSLENDNKYWLHVFRARPSTFATLLGDTSWLLHALHGESKRKVVAEM